MIEEQLVDYGMAGLFIAYLVYDRTVLIKNITRSIDKLREVIDKKL
jgi:hypothetical protein